MGTYDYAQAGYSPETVAWLDNLVAQRQALSNKYGAGTALNNPEWMYSRQVQDGASDSYSTVFTPEDELRTIMSSGQDAATIFDPGYNVQSWGGSRTPNAFDLIRLGAGKTYTLTDNNTGKTYTASTPEQVKMLPQLAKSLSGAGNNTASWGIKDSSGKEVASDTSYTPDFWKQSGQMIADSLPAIMATMALGPGAGWALSGLTAGGATAAYQGAKGASLEDSLLAGLKAGVLTGATTFASPYINSALTNAGLDFPGMSSFFPAGSPGAFDMGGAYSGAVGAAPGVSEAFQVGALTPNFSGFGGLTSGALGSLTQLPQLPEYNAYDESNGYDAPPPDNGMYQDPTVEGVTVPGTRLPTTSISLAPIAASAIPPRASSFYPQEDVTVSSTRPKDPTLPLAPIAASAIPSAGEQWLTSQAAKNAAEPIVGEPAEEPSALDKYLRYASLGLTGASLLGGLFGGSGGQTGAGGTIPAGFGGAGKLPPGFGSGSASLPTGAAIPAYGGGVTPESRMGRTAADLGDIDYLRYGFGPEKSFFTNAPQRAAKGGSMPLDQPSKSFAVRGEGDGRSDDIPAVLSDGEYVIDAETVALLGNGSNKAGAAQLDRFRANIRKHKGKELAKGRFSVNAKKPQAYLAGGRT